MRLVLDLSSNDLLSLDVACWKAHGVTGVICGVYSPMDAPHPMANAADYCRRNGLSIEAFYGFTYFGNQQAVERDCRWAVGLAKNFSVPLVFMDAETDANLNGWGGSTPPPAQRIRELEDVRRIIESAGIQPGVYTYESFWVHQLADSKAFADLPLWYANYGANDGAKPPISTVHFGGWSSVWAHQFTSLWGVTNGCGRGSRDCSYLFGEGEGMNDRDILAVFGSTETDPAERLVNARARYEEAATGAALSPRDLAVNAGLTSVKHHKHTTGYAEEVTP